MLENRFHSSMNFDPSLPNDSRRNFVKKSLAASIIAAQPTILAGLIRAQGGGRGTGTTDPWGGTEPVTESVWNTDPSATTDTETTFFEITGFEVTGYTGPDPLVLVCTKSPESTLPSSTKPSAGRKLVGNPPVIPRNYVLGADIDPYQHVNLLGWVNGPVKGDLSFTTFSLMVGANVTASGRGFTDTQRLEVFQEVGFDDFGVTFAPPLGSDVFLGTVDGRNFDGFAELEEGLVKTLRARWDEGDEWDAVTSAW